MNFLLKGAEEYANAYFDDTTIFSNSWNDHLQHPREVFSRIKDANLTVRPSKCVIGGYEVEVVGHVVGSGRIRTKLAKVRAISDYPKPSTKKRTESFPRTDWILS